MNTRRNILGGSLVVLALALSPVHGQDKAAEIRIGTQKGGYFPAVRHPPLLEAINAGSVDFGFVGRFPADFRAGWQRRDSAT